MSALRETRFSDVCGTVDELKRVLNEEPEAGARDAGRLVGFVEDCAAMLARMGEIEDSRRSSALAVAEDMAQRLREGRALTAEEVARLSDQAEQVRGVAGEMEVK